MKTTAIIALLVLSTSVVNGNPISKYWSSWMTPAAPKCGSPCEAEKPCESPAPCDAPAPCPEPTTEAPVTEAPCPPEPECPEPEPATTPAPCPKPCPAPCSNPCCNPSKRIVMDPEAKKRAKAKMLKVAYKGAKIAKILTAKLAAPFVLAAAKTTALAAALPIVMAAKGALIGKAIALPIKIAAVKTAALATGIAGLTVGVPVAIKTGIIAGAVGLKEKIKGMRKVETCCQTPPCLSKSPCAAAGLPESDPMTGADGTDSSIDMSTPAEGMEDTTGDDAGTGAPEDTTGGTEDTSDAPTDAPTDASTTPAAPLLGMPKLPELAKEAVKAVPKVVKELPKVAKELPKVAKEVAKVLPK